MSVTINVNGLSLVHQASGGVANATAPDVCLTPAAPSPVPVPYPDVAFSRDLAKGTGTVLVDGGNSAAIRGSEYGRSTGDEPGSVGGVVSGVNTQEATWISSSFNVKMEGKAACRLTDKMLMNHGNTVCLSGTGNEPASEGGGEAEAPAEPDICATGPIIVQCGHKRRSFILTSPSEEAPDPEVPDNVFQVVAGPTKSDTIKARTNIVKPTCAKHGGNLLKLMNDEPTRQTRTRVTFPVVCNEEYNRNVIYNIWPYPANVEHYQVKPLVCYPIRAGGIRVDVFPDIRWSGALHFVWKEGGSDFDFDYDLSCIFDGRKHPISDDIKEAIDAYVEFLDTVRQLAGYVDSGMSMLGAVDEPLFTIEWPSLHLKGTWGYKENPQTNAVEYPLDIKLEATPILGINGKIDILDALLNLGGPIGKALQLAKRVAEKGVDTEGFGLQATLAIWLIGGAKISGMLHFKKTLGGGRIVPSGELRGDIMLAIEGEASAKGHIVIKKGWFGHLEGHGSVGVRARGEGSIYGKLRASYGKRGICCTGTMGMGELKVSYAAWIQGDIKVKALIWEKEAGLDKSHKGSNVLLERRVFIRKQAYLLSGSR